MIGINVLIFCLSALFLSCATKGSPEIGTSMEIQVEKEQDSTMSPFLLGVGDEVSINVWRNENLTRTLRIDPSGMVQLPLVGNIQAAGKTPSQLADIITVSLSRYLVHPKVDVNTTTLRNHRVYVMGEVKSPGVITLDHQVLFWEALAASGGFTNDANQRNVLLIRRQEDVIRITVLNLDVTSQIVYGKFEMGPRLKDNDIIYVPTSSIADYTRFAQRITAIISPIIGVEQSIILLPQTMDALGGLQQSGSIVVPH